MVVRKFAAAFAFIISFSSLPPPVFAAENDEDVRRLFSGVIKVLGATNPVFVLRSEVNVSKNFECETPCSHVFYNDDASYKEVILRIGTLADAKQLDMLLFVGAGHSQLIRHLQNRLGTFNFGTYGIMESQYRALRLSLRLDTKILFFERTNDRGFRLVEEYSVMGRSVESRQVGYWRRAGGGGAVRMTSRGIWDRRSNLMGVQLRNTVLTQGALTTVERDSERGVVAAKGSLQRVWRHLEALLNFTTVLNEPADGKFGLLSKSGWDGSVRMLLDARTDVVTCGLTRSPARAQVVDFTAPLAQETATFFMYKSPHAWRTAALVSVWVTPLVFLVVNNLSARIPRAAIFRRVLFFALGVLAYLSVANYSHLLQQFTLLRLPPDVLGSFDDLFEKGYSIITVKSTASHGLLADSDPGSTMNNLYQKGTDNNIVTAVEDIAEAKQKLRESGGAALLFGSAQLMGDDTEDFLQLRFSDGVGGNVGWALQKHSEFTELFDYHIGKMRKSGTLSKIMDKKPDSAELAAASFDSREETLPFVATAVGVLVTGIFIGKTIS